MTGFPSRLPNRFPSGFQVYRHHLALQMAPTTCTIPARGRAVVPTNSPAVRSLTHLRIGHFLSSSCQNNSEATIDVGRAPLPFTVTDRGIRPISVSEWKRQCLHSTCTCRIYCCSEQCLVVLCWAAGPKGGQLRR
jgi:hypothetical protein